MRIRVKVKPNAGRNEVEEIGENYYEVRVTVPPERGKANEMAKELLSKVFRVPKTTINIVSGRTSKEKIIEIDWHDFIPNT